MVDSGCIDYSFLSNDLRRIPKAILVDNYSEEELYNLNEIDRMRALALRNEIWVEAAFFVKNEHSIKMRKIDIDLLADIRFLLKDISDVNRIKATGKTNSILQYSDFPSYDKKINKENDIKIRKEFLRNLADNYRKHNK